jgi:hypothetical protein
VLNRSYNSLVRRSAILIFDHFVRGPIPLFIWWIRSWTVFTSFWIESKCDASNLESGCGYGYCIYSAPTPSHDEFYYACTACYVFFSSMFWLIFHNYFVFEYSEERKTKISLLRDLLQQAIVLPIVGDLYNLFIQCIFLLYYWLFCMSSCYLNTWNNISQS